MELNGLKNQAAEGEGVECAFCHSRTRIRSAAVVPFLKSQASHVLKTGQPPMRGAILGSPISLRELGDLRQS